MRIGILIIVCLSILATVPSCKKENEMPDLKKYMDKVTPNYKKQKMV